MPRRLTTLQHAGISTNGLSSKGNDAFEGCPPDIVITVCDKAAGEACPVYFGPALKSHWGLEDPSDVVADEASVDAAFRATLASIEARCQAFFALPFDHLDRDQLKDELDRIGNPNIVINGDAELIHVLDFNSQCHVKQTGSLQEQDMRQYVCQVMVGGSEAFKHRYQRLGGES